MWKLLPFLFLSLFLNGQPYGQFKYPHSGVYTTSAFKTSINSNGHLIVGYKPNSIASTYNFCIDKTNPSGGFTASVFSFKKEYQLFNTTGCIAGNPNQILNCSGLSAIETSIPGNPKAWYAITGVYDEGCFFATLDSLGRPINAKGYVFPYINPMSSFKSYIAESKITPGNYYISGTFDSTIYVLKVNTTGTVLWSGYYHNGTTFFSTSDIMECPFTGNLLVFGSSNAPAPYITTGTNGFILSLDRNNGNINTYRGYSQNFQNCQLFTHAKPAFSPTGGQGYVIGGSTQGYPTAPWVLKVGTAGNIIWSKVLMPSTDNGAIIVEDIIERPVGSTYEYYPAIRSAAAGMIVLKLDDNGNPIVPVNNEFAFNTSTAVIATTSNIDYESSGPNIALTTYGTVDGSNGGEMYMVRSYFNGISGCNETKTLISNYYAGPDTVYNLSVNRFGSLSVCNLFSLADVSVTYTPIILCSNPVISGGSNSGVTGIEEIKSENGNLTLFPNPTQSKTNISFTVDVKSKVEIMLYNSMGQHLKTILDSDLAAGSHSAEIDLSELKLEGGIYFLRLINNRKTSIYKIIYTK